MSPQPTSSTHLITIRLFARARDLEGSDLVTMAVPTGTTVGDLRRSLAQHCPRLSSLLEHSALAVNDEYADNELTVPVDAQVALIPPVSGG